MGKVGDEFERSKHFLTEEKKLKPLSDMNFGQSQKSDLCIVLNELVHTCNSKVRNFRSTVRIMRHTKNISIK